MTAMSVLSKGRGEEWQVVLANDASHAKAQGLVFGEVNWVSLGDSFKAFAVGTARFMFF